MLEPKKNGGHQHGPGRSVPMLIVVKCEDHSANQAPQVLHIMLQAYFLH